MSEKEMLPAHFEAHGPQLRVVGSPSHQDFLECLDTLGRVETRVNWWLGDLLLWACEKFGHDQIKGYAARWNKEESTFREYRRIAATWKPEDRDPDMSWTHHQYCSGMESREDRMAWLARAKQEGWSALRLTRAIRQERDDAKLRKEIRDNKFRPPRDAIIRGKAMDVVDVCSYIETCSVGELNKIRKALQTRAIMHRISPGRKSSHGNVSFIEWWGLWPPNLQKEKADCLGLWNQLDRNNENMGKVYEATEQYLADRDVATVGPAKPRLFLRYQFWKLGPGRWADRKSVV